MLNIALLVVILTVLIIFWLEWQDNLWINKLLNWFPPILFAYLIPAAVTHSFRLNLSSVVLHAWSKEFIIPFAILMVMSALSFKQLKSIGLKPILLFVFGSFVIAVLAPLLLLISTFFSDSMYQLLIDNSFWKGMVTIVGSWIGGSTSQLVLKELVSCSEPMFLAILVLDNILVNIWTILMFQMIKKSDRLNAYFNIKDQIKDFVPEEISYKYSTFRSISLTLLLSICIISLISYFMNSFLWKIVVLSIIGLCLGNFVRGWNHSLVLKIGSILIVLIMAILGLKLDFESFSFPILLVGFVIVWLVLHFIIMLWFAKRLGLHMAWVPIASMANLGGISTAPAVTAAYNKEWMPYAIVLAILSMVSGTSWGVLTIFLFQLFI